MMSHRILIAAALIAAGRVVAVEGTIPNLTYPTNQLFKQISPQLSHRHLNPSGIVPKGPALEFMGDTIAKTAVS